MGVRQLRRKQGHLQNTTNNVLGVMGSNLYVLASSSCFLSNYLYAGPGRYLRPRQRIRFSCIEKSVLAQCIRSRICVVVVLVVFFTH